MIHVITYRNETSKTLLPYLHTLYAEENNISVGKLITSIENDTFVGWTSVMKDDNDLISCAAAEVSPHYTDDVSLRFCRYYKMKSKRKIRYNVYPYFKTFITICRQHGFKVFYLSVHDERVIKDTSNSRIRRMYNGYIDDISMDDFVLRDDIMLATSPGCVQQIYAYIVEPGYVWNPRSDYIISTP
jgi:hypothetical protein